LAFFHEGSQIVLDGEAMRITHFDYVEADYTLVSIQVHKS